MQLAVMVLPEFDSDRNAQLSAVKGLPYIGLLRLLVIFLASSLSTNQGRSLDPGSSSHAR